MAQQNWGAASGLMNSVERGYDTARKALNVVRRVGDATIGRYVHVGNGGSRSPIVRKQTRENDDRAVERANRSFQERQARRDAAKRASARGKGKRTSPRRPTARRALARATTRSAARRSGL